RSVPYPKLHKGCRYEKTEHPERASRPRMLRAKERSGQHKKGANESRLRKQENRDRACESQEPPFGPDADPVSGLENIVSRPSIGNKQDHHEDREPSAPFRCSKRNGR